MSSVSVVFQKYTVQTAKNINANVTTISPQNTITIKAKPSCAAFVENNIKNQTIVSNIAGSIIIGGGGSGYMYKTTTDMQSIGYDQIKDIYFTSVQNNIEGDIISLLIMTDDEDIEHIGSVNMVGKTIEFKCDFDATKAKARVKYLRIA